MERKNKQYKSWLIKKGMLVASTLVFLVIMFFLL